MNITIVQGAFLPVPPIAGGAVEKLWFDLGREFARRGLGVTHISRVWPGLPAAGSVDGVTHLRVGGFNYPRSPLLAKLMDLIYSLRCLLALKRSDVVVTNTFFLPLLLSLLPRRGIVYVSVHRYPHGQMRLYAGVDRLQCVSSAVADAVREQSPTVSELVKVVPNYVSSRRSLDEVTSSWDGRAHEVLFVGRVHPEKGIDLLLEAYARLGEKLRGVWRLVVVGPHEAAGGGGGADYLAQLQGRAVELGIAVHWVGPVYERDALNAHFGRARVLVYPSVAAHGEAFPLAPLEAMAQGCPVVVSDLQCFEDYIAPGHNSETFALGSGDRAGSLCMVLESLLADDARQRRYAQAGLATVERFSLASVADALIDDFSQLRQP